MADRDEFRAGLAEYDAIVDRPSIASRPRTLAVSIDPPELAATLLGPNGAVLAGPAHAAVGTEPHEVLRSLWQLVESLGEFDRISVGYAGAVLDGVTRGDGAWDQFALEAALTAESLRPARAISTAELAITVEGVGVELALTIGERFTSALYVHGIALPGFELGRHRFRKKLSYADYVAGTAFTELGRKKWNKRVHRVIEATLATFNPRRLYLGGRDARLIYGELPEHVVIVTASPLAGALELWR
jgi:polyphosphate glucokinase